MAWYASWLLMLALGSTLGISPPNTTPASISAFLHRNVRAGAEAGTRLKIPLTSSSSRVPTGPGGGSPKTGPGSP
jgi:hypothetical protein